MPRGDANVQDAQNSFAYICLCWSLIITNYAIDKSREKDPNKTNANAEEKFIIVPSLMRHSPCEHLEGYQIRSIQTAPHSPGNHVKVCLKIDESCHLKYSARKHKLPR